MLSRALLKSALRTLFASSTGLCLLAITGCSENEPAETSGLSAKAIPAPEHTAAPDPPAGSEIASSAAIPSAPNPAVLEPDASPVMVAPGADRSEYIGPLKDAYDRIDPIKDGWETEAFSSAALEQLHHLEPVVLEPDLASEADLASIVSPLIKSDLLRPDTLEKIFEDSRLVVQRAPGRQPGSPTTVTGAAAFLTQLRALGAGSDPEHTRIKLKIFRVEPRDDGTTSSDVLCAISTATATNRFQINATWKCVWQTAGAAPPLLVELHVLNHEEVNQSTSGTALFEDCTAAVLSGNAAYTEQFLTQTDHWRAQLPRDLGIDPVANHGLAIGDVNGDELDDLYVCQQGGLPNRLFIQQPDGTLSDVSAGSGTDLLDYCAAALLIDLDNDGDRDLIVSEDFRLHVLSNDGKGKFTLEFGSSTEAQSFSLAAADFDNDGLVDFYVCGYNPSVAARRGGAMGEPMPFHDANNGGPSMLWRNTGDFNFEDVTESSGISQNNTRYTFAAAWEDYDNDGDQDLYVANDYGRNCLYRNEGGTFTDIAPNLEVEDTSSGMSVSWGDFNNDGQMDLYTSNMFSSAGNRITYQRQFKQHVPEEVRKQFQHIALGNTLFQATPGGTFTDVSASATVQMGRWAWGSRFVDFNNDGLEDILVANGFITTEDTTDL